MLRYKYSRGGKLLLVGNNNNIIIIMHTNNECDMYLSQFFGDIVERYVSHTRTGLKTNNIIYNTKYE